ncbi:hypothetical protein PCI56_13455 [Plesiomonas shigelloides subsp. oncorhynchi]|nr:hypothetical protein [Plesiomonas shigelloides]
MNGGKIHLGDPRTSKPKLQPEDILNLIGPEIPKLDWAKDLSQMVERTVQTLFCSPIRAALVVNKDGKVSGITVTAESKASAVDFPRGLCIIH